VDILVVDLAGTFTEIGEDVIQRLTAGSTAEDALSRCLRPELA
jgi:hypothetical protein